MVYVVDPPTCSMKVMDCTPLTEVQVARTGYTSIQTTVAVTVDIEELVVTVNVVTSVVVLVDV